MKLSHFQFVISFQNDRNILLNNGHRLTATSTLVEGTIHPTNIPEGSPPEAPRAIIRGKEVLINIASNRFEIISISPTPIQNNPEEFISYNINKLENIINSLLSENIIYLWSGLVIKIDYPVPGKNTGIKNCEPIFDKLVNIQRNNFPLSTFQLQFGFTKNNKNISYMISGYEERSYQFKEPIKIPAGESINIDLNLAKLDESGISVIFDINNKNLLIKNPLIDFKDISKESLYYINRIGIDLNIKDLI